jgi:two-component system sensor histidine kinase SenX3
VSTTLDNWELALTAMFIGAGFTALAALMYFRLRLSNRVDSSIPDALAIALPALSEAGLVLDPQDRVVRATQEAHSLGLIKNKKLRHAKLLTLVEKTRSSKILGKARAKDLTLTASLSETKLHVKAKAVNLGAGFVMLLVEDLTEAQALEATRRDFVANISHELKTPIGSIVLLSEAIQSAIDDPRQLRKFTKSLEAEANRLGDLVQEIIELSKVQSADLSVTSTSVNLLGVLEEAIAQTKVLANKSQIEIELEAEKNVIVFGDRQLLTAAARNLIENAISYSDQGKPVKVSLRVRGKLAEIVVRDKGIGISALEQDRIFERFYRVDQSRSRKTGGTGLGLSITRNIIQKHFGQITVKSKINSGSSFRIRLPLAVSGSNQEDFLK